MKGKFTRLLALGLATIFVLTGCSTSAKAPADTSQKSGQTTSGGASDTRSDDAAKADDSTNPDDGARSDDGTNPGDGTKAGNGGADLSQQEPYEVKWFFPCANVPTNLEKIEDAVNAITEPAINVTVDFECITISNYENQVTLMTSSGEKLDIFVAMGNTVTNYYENGACIPITEYLDSYGQDIIDTVNSEYGEEYLKAFRIDGDLYSVPTMHSVVNQTGFTIAQYIVDELNLTEDLSKVETLADMTPILAKIKEAYPDMYPVTSSPRLGVLTQYLEGVFDDIGDTYVVLEGYENSDVVNRFATDTYKELLYVVRDWYEKGYIMPGINTNDTEIGVQIKEGKACMSLGQTQPRDQNGQIHTYATTATGMPMLNYCLTESRMTTKQMASPQIVISVNSDAPQRAIQLLNLFYTSPELNTLVNFGIEGQDYVKTADDNVITFPEGVDINNVEYSVKFGWAFPNQFLSYVWEGTSSDEWEQTKTINHSGKPSLAAGFLFLTGPVSTEIATVKSVVDKYALSLENGSVDVDTVLPEFLKALEDAGINKVIDEKQRQLDQWLAMKQ